MRVSDYCVYEIDVEFTQTIDHRDQCGDVYDTTKHPGTKRTIRIVADTYHDGYALAHVQRLFRFQQEKDVKIIETRRLQLDAFIETNGR